MGGYNSGRRGGKDCTDDMRRIDVRRLHRDGYLKQGMAYGWQWQRHGETVASINLSVQADRVTFTYRHRAGGGDWQDVNCTAWLDRTPCTYGGTRAWWRCPCCGRRVAIPGGPATPWRQKAIPAPEGLRAIRARPSTARHLQ